MQKRKCKLSNIELSVLGTGCCKFDGGDYWGDQQQKDVTGVVHAPVDSCINYCDTAEANNEGRSEISLGEGIKGISRDKIVIGTKVITPNCYKRTLLQCFLFLIYCVIAPITIIGQTCCNERSIAKLYHAEQKNSNYNLESDSFSKNKQNTLGQNLIANGNFNNGAIGSLPDGWLLNTPNPNLAPTFKLVKGKDGANLLMAHGNGRKQPLC